jgi:cytochrome c oxidase subunit 2
MRGLHIHRAERLWMTIGIGMLVFFLGFITTAALVDGVVPPSHVQSIDPTKVDQTPPFDKPGLRKLANGDYEAYYVARIFSFTPRHVVVPIGAHVTFYVTSADVEHGFSIPETSINTMVTPGWVSTVAYTFRQPGKFLLVCNEYCGAGHQLMAADVEVR